MTISIQCTHCQKRYNAPGSMAGKKVKCKHCGKIFAIPANAASEAMALADAGDESPTPASPAARQTPSPFARADKRPAVRVGDDTPPTRLGERGGIVSKVARPEDIADIDVEGDDAPVMSLRPNVPFDFPGADALDRFLPAVSIVMGVGLLALVAFSYNLTGAAWPAYMRLGMYLVILLGVLFPAGYYAIGWASRKCRFGLPFSPALRTLAVVALPFSLAIALWVATESNGMLVLGTVLGIMAACGGVWFLFRLEQREMPTTCSAVAGAFAGSVAAGFILLLVLNLILLALEKKKENNELAMSPVGPTFEWVPRTADEPVKKRPTKTIVQATTDQATTTPGTTAPSTQSTAIAVTPPNTSIFTPGTNPPQPPTTNNPGTAMATNTGTDPVTRPPTPPVDPTNPPTPPITTPPTTPPTPPVTTTNPPVTPPVTPGANAVPEIASPLVAKISALIELPSGEETVVYAAGGAPFALVVKPSTAGHDVDLYSLAGETRGKVATAAFPKETGVAPRFALSANGDTLAHIVTFPKLALSAYSFKEQKEIRSHVLDSSLGVPELVAYGQSNPRANIDAVMLEWEKTGLRGYEVINLGSQQTRRIAAFDAPRHVPSGTNPVIGPDGRWLAMATRTGASGQIELWDLAQSLRKPAKDYKVPLATWTEPAGLALSADGKQIAAVFYDPTQTRGVLYRFSSDARPMKEHVLFAPPAGARDFAKTARTLDFMPDAATLVLYGSQLMDVESGKPLGELGVEGVKGQHVIDRETIALEVAGRILEVKLRADALAAKRAEIRGGKPVP